ncbi:MAG: beta-ribofuranosylaminobenzene 5'-phosphate synthase [Planctomycetota bacterium]|nr:beta-ribofuranosylaminobenzene 5'-phosphate synthase [Planctomycetota bacterium]
MPDSAANNRRPNGLNSSAVRVRTGSRLHFGLLDTAAPFGGIGVMIADPATEIVVSRCERFEAGPIETARITNIAQRVAQLSNDSALPNLRVELPQLAPQHAGLGSGTQLSMAVAEAFCHLMAIKQTPEQLATKVAGRGKRSAVGWQGYFQGGLIFEAGTNGNSVHGTSLNEIPVNAVQQRVELPPSWSVVVLRPRAADRSVSGELESQKFHRLPEVAAEVVAELRSQIQKRILPAASAADFHPFADAISRYNAASGELFRSVQNGTYNGPAVTALIHWLREQNIRGVGQSSWGPGVFAWFENRVKANQLVQSLPNWIEPITIANPRNEARQLLEIDVNH